MLKLEKYTEADAPLYAQLVFNEQVMNRNLGRVFTDDEAEMFFAVMLEVNAANGREGFYKALDGEKYTGMGALEWNEEENAWEIEYMLLPQFWNRGYGTNLVELLLELARESGKGTHVIAVTDPANIYSQRILRNKNFVFVKEYINADGEPAELYRRSL